MPASRKPDPSQPRGRRTGERGASTVGASWFVLVLLLTLFCFGWYVDSTTRIRTASVERARLEEKIAARRDRTEYKRTQAKALSALIGFRSAVPTLPGSKDEAAFEVSRVKDLKDFAEELAQYSQPMFERGTTSSTHKPDFYLKRALDEDSMVPPAQPMQAFSYDADAYENASDKRKAGFDVMQEARKRFLEPFGGDASDVRTEADGAAALKFRDIRSQWATLFESAARNVAGDTAAAEIAAIERVRSTGSGDGWAPTVPLTEIVHQIALKYQALEADTEALRAAWEAAHGAAVPPSGTAWSDLRHIAYAGQTGNQAEWDLDAARSSVRSALQNGLGAVYGNGSATDDQVDAFVSARLAAIEAAGLVSLLGGKAPEFQGDDFTPKPFTPLSSDEQDQLTDARSALEQANQELGRVEQQLGKSGDAPSIGGRFDHLVTALSSIDRFESLVAFLTRKEGGDQTYDASTDGYRSFLNDRVESIKSGLARALGDMRTQADSFDSEYATAFAERTGLGSDVYEDPHGRAVPSVGGEPKDVAEAYGLPYGETRGPKDLESVLGIGIGDLSQVLTLMQAEVSAVNTQRDDVVVPKTESTLKSVRDRGQRLGSLLVSDAIETVFPDVSKGRVLDAPAGPVRSVRIAGNAGLPVAFLDLDATHNVQVGTRFHVVEPLPGGGKLVKALATIDRVGTPGQPSRAVLRYLPGVDPLTHAVVKGDRLENPIFNATLRRNVVILAPENQTFSANRVRDALQPNHFRFQDAIDENTDMVILAASRRDSLRAMAAASEDEFGDGAEVAPWFQENETFLEAERRGLSIFFFEDDVRPRLPGGVR